MASARAPAKGLQISDDELQQMLALVDDADSVELKLTVPEADQRSAVLALGMDPLNAQIRQVFFFDTPELALYNAGVVARARRVQKKGDDSVVKLRPVVPAELPGEMRTSPNMTVEVDAMPGGFVCSAALKRTLGTTDVRSATMGDRRLRKLFSKEQRAFFAEHAPSGIELDDLRILGPIFVLKLKFTPPGRERRMVAEMWMYPDNTRILELSTKCAPGEALDVAARAKGFLMEKGVNVTGEQQTKTRTALDFFAREMKRARRTVASKPKPRARKPRTTKPSGTGSADGDPRPAPGDAGSGPAPDAGPAPPAG